MTTYHAHITVSSITNVPKGWKQTDIVLENTNKTQHDCMLTKHYKIGAHGITSVNDIITDVSNQSQLLTVPVIRVKLEQDSNFTIPISDINYIEVHARCYGINAVTNTKWVRSTNPNKLHKNGTPLFFYTRRFYSGEINDVYSQVSTELYHIKTDEVKFEQVIFDSNVSHDSWWTG